MEEIADELLEYQIKFQTFFEQVTELLEKNDPKLIERIQFKSSKALIKKMEEYYIWLQNDGFKITDIRVKGKLVPGWFIKESFEKFHRMPLLKRFNEVVREVVQNVFLKNEKSYFGCYTKLKIDSLFKSNWYNSNYNYNQQLTSYIYMYKHHIYINWLYISTI